MLLARISDPKNAPMIPASIANNTGLSCINSQRCNNRAHRFLVDYKRLALPVTARQRALETKHITPK
jgi:hypothetical protein